MRHSNQIHCRIQILFIAHNERDVAGFGRPTMRARFALGKNSGLIIFRQLNVAVTRAMDMHEHCPSNKKRVFVDSRVLPLGHIGKRKNPVP